MIEAISESDKELVFFTLPVDGRVYGGWYRLLTPVQLELLAIGLIRRVPLLNSSPEDAARRVLGEFVRSRVLSGQPIPSLGAAPSEVQNFVVRRIDCSVSGTVN